MKNIELSEYPDRAEYIAHHKAQGTDFAGTVDADYFHDLAAYWEDRCRLAYDVLLGYSGHRLTCSFVKPETSHNATCDCNGKEATRAVVAIGILPPKKE